MMKKLILCVMALAALPIGSLLAQDIIGDWQGTLQANQALRIVFKITKSDTGSPKAVMYSIDQGGMPIPVTSVTLQGSSVKMTLNMISGAYEGTLNAGGASITGTWTQGGGKPLPLTLDRATKETAWAIPAKLKPMGADASPVFEVATIKPSQPGRPGKGIRVQPGRHFSTLNTSLSDLMTFSYGIHPRQITGAPDWVATEKYDITAQPDGEGEPNDKQWKMMLQKLLTERFKLAFHRDKKELTVYAIVVGKTGSKLTKSEGDPNGLPGLGFRGLGALIARNANMTDFAGLLQSTVLDRPVVDQSELPGRYDFTLNWTPDETQFGGLGMRPPPPADNASSNLPDLFTAMQEQLGLRLKPSKEPVDVLVIDHVEKPSEN
jgi:uncharacterized protein (TIGR03435 family)